MVAPASMTASRTWHRKFRVGAGGVFGREFHVGAECPRIGGHSWTLEGLLARQAQLVVQVQIGSREERVQAGTPRRSAVERRVQCRDARRARAASRGAANVAGDGAHAFEVSARRQWGSRPR